MLKGLVTLFIAAAILFFFIALAGGFKKIFSMTQEVLEYENAKKVLTAGGLLLLIIITGAAITREGVTIKDILFLQ